MAPASQQWRPGTITVHRENPAGAKHPPIELYDLKNDPHERENLAGSPEHDFLLQTLLARLGLWMRETGDPLLEGPVPAPLHHAGVEAISAAMERENAEK